MIEVLITILILSAIVAVNYFICEYKNRKSFERLSEFIKKSGGLENTELRIIGKVVRFKKSTRA